MVYRQTKYVQCAFVFLLFILVTNVLLYQPPVHRMLSIEIKSEVVAGSLIDLVIIAPLLSYFVFKLSIKQTIGLMAAGLILARFLIPAPFFAPYKGILYAGIAAEGLLVAAELVLVFYVLRKIPHIRREMNNHSALYSLLPAIEKTATKNKIVILLVSEFLLFYYAFCTWRKKTPMHKGTVTMHKKTSAIAMHIMVIHAIVIETIGIHWWLHEKSMILSLILLILNIYSILFFLAEIQVTRLHPVEIKEDRLYAAQGLTQRIIVPLSMIKEMKWGAKPDKKALEFMLREFEPVEAQVVIVLHEPVEATMFMGRKKCVSELAFRVDEPEKLKHLLETE